MKPSKKNIQTWINALRSGQYEQGRGALEPQRDQYCCLGVACDLFIPRKYQDKHLADDILLGGVPADQGKAPIWLKAINEDFHNLTDIALSRLNDNELLTFDEIADLLQAVYIEQVLK